MSDRFGTLPDGAAVHRCSIAGGGLSAQILTYGATLQDLRLDGFGFPLVLGAPTLDSYVSEMTYFGATVGRFANRIAGGRFKIHGQSFQVPANWLDKHSLHGGPVGTGQKIWDIIEHSGDRLTLGLTLPDGDMGFPGCMQVSVTYSLPGDGVLSIEIAASADAVTPCSFANHSYFNLDGTGRITDHSLEIDAAAYLPVDEDLIPTGEIAPVDGTAFDFREARDVGTEVIDHNYCLSDRAVPLRPIAKLHSTASDLLLTVETTEPGLQVYNGAYIPADGIAGLEGRRYGPFAGIALETQGWPDAPNQPQFPSALLRTGELYRHRVNYSFSKIGNCSE